MTPKELAERLNGREYGSEITLEEMHIAKEFGLVVVFGASDDLMEFRGAIDDEGGCFGGGTVYFDQNGVAQDDEAIKSFEIEAIWGHEGYSWVYETDIPHETFDILEEGWRYCRGIVFSVEDLKTQEKYSEEDKERYFNTLRGVAASSFLESQKKQELIDFITYIEEAR